MLLPGAWTIVLNPMIHWSRDSIIRLFNYSNQCSEKTLEKRTGIYRNGRLVLYSLFSCSQISGVYLYKKWIDCSFQAVVEDSTNLLFAPNTLDYGHLTAPWATSGLDPAVNNWDQVPLFSVKVPSSTTRPNFGHFCIFFLKLSFQVTMTRNCLFFLWNVVLDQFTYKLCFLLMLEK